MKDQPDIVARLRAYTQHNRPVLASDLKEAADEVERLRRLLTERLATYVAALSRDDSHVRLLRYLFEGVHEAVGSVTVPPINTQTVDELVSKTRAMRESLDETTGSLIIADGRSSILVDLVRSVSNAAGRKVAPNAFDRADLQHLVDEVAALRRDRDAIMPSDLPEAAEAPPTATPSAERFDEFERRIALLESSTRLTARRLSATAAIMSEAGDRYAYRCSFAASVAVMIHKGLTTDERDLPVEAVSE